MTDKSDTKQVLKVDIQEARAAVFTLRRHNHEAGAIAVDGVCNSHSALVAENERLKATIQAMADEGWLWHGIEGMSNAQQLVSDILTTKAST